MIPFPVSTSRLSVPASALVAALALVAPSPASAQVVGHTTLGSLRYTLTDLDPLDGITPSLQFAAMPFVPGPGQERAVARRHAYYGNGETYQEFEVFNSGTEPLTFSYEDSVVSVTQTLSGRDTAQNHQIDLGGAAQTDGVQLRHAFADLNTGPLGFVMTPNTAVVFDLTLDVDASISSGPELTEFYESVANFYLVMGNDPNIGFDSDHRFYAIHSSGVFGDVRSIDITDVLSVSYENRSASSIDGVVRFDAWAYTVAGPLPVVPEPATLPMVAAGLFVVAAWTKRRFRRRH